MLTVLDKFTPDHWMGVLFFFVLLMWGIATFLFGRISVKHIEREMAKEGIEPPIWDKGIGSIVVTYSLIMVFSKLKPLIVDFEAVRRHTRKKDKKLALMFVISLIFTFTLTGIIYYLYSADS